MISPILSARERVYKAKKKSLKDASSVVNAGRNCQAMPGSAIAAEQRKMTNRAMF